MRIEKSGQPLPYSREQLFDLASDIERYPQFLRGWQSARILQHEGTTLQVQQSVGIGALQLTFRTTAVLQRPERIEITSPDPMFRAFELHFVITGSATGGSRLCMSARLEMYSRLQQVIIGAALSAVVTDTVAAFEARAHRLYSRR
jgi:coenzyme Q-binding protein COQ10